MFSISPGYVCLYYFILPRAVSGPWNYLFLVCREKHYTICSLLHFAHLGSGNAKETILFGQTGRHMSLWFLYEGCKTCLTC